MTLSGTLTPELSEEIFYNVLIPLLVDDPLWDWKVVI